MTASETPSSLINYDFWISPAHMYQNPVPGY